VIKVDMSDCRIVVKRLAFSMSSRKISDGPYCAPGRLWNLEEGTGKSKPGDSPRFSVENRAQRCRK